LQFSWASHKIFYVVTLTGIGKSIFPSQAIFICPVSRSNEKVR
jgi:hypothetical protein